MIRKIQHIKFNQLKKRYLESREGMELRSFQNILRRLSDNGIRVESEIISPVIDEVGEFADCYVIYLDSNHAIQVALSYDGFVYWEDLRSGRTEMLSLSDFSRKCSSL